MIGKLHILKLKEDFAHAVYLGDKNFEIRENDRGYQKNDSIQFKVVNESGMEINHPVQNKKYLITYVISGWGLKEGYVVFGIKEAI